MYKQNLFFLMFFTLNLVHSNKVNLPSKVKCSIQNGVFIIKFLKGETVSLKNFVEVKSAEVSISEYDDEEYNYIEISYEHEKEAEVIIQCDSLDFESDSSIFNYDIESETCIFDLKGKDVQKVTRPLTLTKINFKVAEIRMFNITNIIDTLSVKSGTLKGNIENFSIKNFIIASYITKLDMTKTSVLILNNSSKNTAINLHDCYIQKKLGSKVGIHEVKN